MTNFIVTKEYKRFAEFCNACKEEQYIGLCYGPAGVGKSMSANYFAKWYKLAKPISEFIKNNMISSDILPIIPELKRLCTIVYTPQVHNTPVRVRDEVYDLLCAFNDLKEMAIYNKRAYSQRNYVKVIIIDEADRLQSKSLEQIREVYDDISPYYSDSKIAVILIGMPGIEKKLVRFPQLYSRIGFTHVFKPLTQEEIVFIIQKHCRKLDISINKDDFTDNEAIAAVSRITQGNFRLIDRLLRQAMRIMKLNRQSYISKEVIEAARECLVIGNV